MKITASGGTDGASIVMFWPETLPDDFDTVFDDDPLSLVERLAGEGRLIRFPCDADGSYSVALFLDVPIPDNLRGLCEDEEHYPHLLIEGTGFFGGMEYMFKQDRSFLDRYPHMCGELAAPAGTYSATTYRVNPPDEVYDAYLERTGAAAMRVWRLHSSVAAGAIISVLGTIVSFFFLSWAKWAAVAGIALTLAILAVLLSRTAGYRAVKAAQQEYEREYPSYVVHLESSGNAAS